jgi:hypothetical protein
MTFTGNTLADMNLLEESPGCYGFSWRFTGLERTQVKVHRAVMDLIKVHRAVMDLIVESPGCSGFTLRKIYCDRPDRPARPFLKLRNFLRYRKVGIFEISEYSKGRTRKVGDCRFDTIGIEIRIE